jgi:hypothetical protein
LTPFAVPVAAVAPCGSWAPFLTPALFLRSRILGLSVICGGERQGSRDRGRVISVRDVPPGSANAGPFMGKWPKRPKSAIPKFGPCLGCVRVLCLPVSSRRACPQKPHDRPPARCGYMKSSTTIARKDDAAREWARLHLTQCRMWLRRPSRKRHDAPRLRSALDPGRQRSGVRVPVHGRRSVARFLLGLDGCNGVSRLLLRLSEFPNLSL